MHSGSSKNQVSELKDQSYLFLVKTSKTVAPIYTACILTNKVNTCIDLVHALISKHLEITTLEDLEQEEMTQSFVSNQSPVPGNFLDTTNVKSKASSIASIGWEIFEPASFLKATEASQQESPSSFNHVGSSSPKLTM